MQILLLRGGLGNQLFIYGKYMIEKKCNKNIFIDDVFGFKYDKTFMRVNMLNSFQLNYKRIGFKLDFFWKLLGKINDDISILFFTNEYFQESRFLDSFNLNISNIYPRICIHIRLKEYSLILTEQQYLEMLNHVIDNNKILPIYFVTDDPGQFKLKMPILYERGACINLNEIQAFTFIAESNQVILSDSSFSFCAAYLGPIKNITYSRLTNIINNGKNNHKWVKF
jgi:hypothetical protein